MLGHSYQPLLENVRQCSIDDLIHECEDVSLEELPREHDNLLRLADEKLHVFPFQTVKSCWFRLYTDASIYKALDLIDHHQHERDTDWLDQVISVLDMALIMAGGLGREDDIHDLLHLLQQDFVSKKQRRVDDTDMLPKDTLSMPRIQFPVHQMHRPSMLSFQSTMQKDRKPILLNGILNHWPALERWKSRKYLLETTHEGRRLVPIEVGRSYVDDDWGQHIVPFRDFLEKHIFDTSGKIGYLAQHDLLKQIRALRKDITIPDYCYLDPPPPDAGTPVALSNATNETKQSHPTMRPATDEETEVHTNIWFGPAWTISPLHHDPYHNILCQVVGTKYVRLYHPRYSSGLYPRSEHEPAPHLDNAGERTINMSNTSKIDIAAMELSPDEIWDDKYSGISTIPYQELVLEPGQALYIPVGWWHYVRSVSVGISVSFWWG